jgi:hypothetical protein
MKTKDQTEIPLPTAAKAIQARIQHQLASSPPSWPPRFVIDNHSQTG